MLLNGGDKLSTSTQSYTSQEERDAHFTQGMDTLSFSELGAEPAFLNAQPTTDDGHY